MKPKFIIGDNLEPIFQHAQWIGTEASEKKLSNTISIVQGQLAYYYLSKKTIKRLTRDGEVLNIDTDKLIGLIAVSDNPLEVISQFIDEELT